MLADFYGNRLTTSTGLARDNYDIGLRAFLSANYGAQEAFAQAVEADPNFSLAYLGLARSFMNSGQIEEAKKTFRKYGWPSIDVTRKSVEETAASIIKIHEIYLNNVK